MKRTRLKLKFAKRSAPALPPYRFTLPQDALKVAVEGETRGYLDGLRDSIEGTERRDREGMKKRCQDSLLLLVTESKYVAQKLTNNWPALERAFEFTYTELYSHTVELYKAQPATLENDRKHIEAHGWESARIAAQNLFAQKSNETLGAIKPLERVS